MDCLAIKLLVAIELTEQVVVWQFVYGIMCLSERDQTFPVPLKISKQSLLKLKRGISKMTGMF